MNSTDNPETAEISFPKGSEWLRWDLHCHTPDDENWKGKPNSEEEIHDFIKKYIDILEENEISIISLTDHYNYRDFSKGYYPRIIEEAEKRGIKVLKGVEITANEGSGIHILVVFSEDVSYDTIDALMKKIYPIPDNRQITKNNIPICEQKIKELNETLKTALIDKYLLIYAHVNTENGVIKDSTISDQPRVQAWKYEFIRFAQWTKNPLDYSEDSFKGRIVRNTQSAYERSIEMIHIVASDCRCLYPDPEKPEIAAVGSKYTWLKTNPSFEGLKQVFFDSEGKIAFQDHNPLKVNKQFFSMIQTGSNRLFQDGNVCFKNVNLDLNPEFIAVIGSRGSGKSLLLDVISKLHGNRSKYNEKTEKMILDPNFLMLYQKDESTIIETNADMLNELDYIHVHQSEFNKICINPVELDGEIRKLLGISAFDYSTESDEYIDKLVNRFFDITDWFESVNDEGVAIHTEEYNKKFIDRFEKKISFIQTSESQENIENLRELHVSEHLLNITLIEAKELKDYLSDVKKKIDQKIEFINRQISDKSKIPPINFKPQIKKIDDNLEVFDKL
ncbi:hypothetical protein LCGC14_0491630 [marine sediment metagenome]|uniref:Polymerase/histidinol phosphatase N-terminal domain-containing protein n=1 Tax=marine sediment metagenome TaxID=412755 RepID=A0A0F9S6C7_9ZZZZ